MPYRQAEARAARPYVYIHLYYNIAQHAGGRETITRDYRAGGEVLGETHYDGDVSCHGDDRSRRELWKLDVYARVNTTYRCVWTIRSMSCRAVTRDTERRPWEKPRRPAWTRFYSSTHFEIYTLKCRFLFGTVRYSEGENGCVSYCRSINKRALFEGFRCIVKRDFTVYTQCSNMG